MKTYEDAVKLLTSPKKFKIDLGLERIEKILDINRHLKLTMSDRTN